MASRKRCLTDGNSGEDESNKTTTIVANNEDLIIEILLRLPVKSLLRFKSVSKGWFSLISNPSFTQNHSLRNPNSVSGLLFLRCALIENPEFEFVSLDENTTSAPFRFLTFVDAPDIKIFQSCNGLLCCCSFNSNDFKRTHYIYNPTTNQYTTLPRPGGRDWYVNLAFDPTKSSHYKAVCVRHSDVVVEPDLPHGSYQIEIYSSETGQWRLSGDPFSAIGDIDFGCGVFCNGALHWINLDGDSLYFNVDQESLRIMPMPQMPEWCEVWDGMRLMYFGESQGHLHLIQIYGYLTTDFDVLEMETDYSGWFVKYCVDLDAITIAYPVMVRNNLDDYAFSILSIVRGKDEAESELLIHIPGMVLSYNLKDETFKKVHDLSPGRTYIELHWWYVFQFIETLYYV